MKARPDNIIVYARNCPALQRTFRKATRLGTSLVGTLACAPCAGVVMGMLFDDRLGTVLRMRADSASVRRIQLRQLVDLLGTFTSDVRGPQIDAAYARLAKLQKLIPAAESARMLEDPALRLRSPRLVATLGGGDHRLADAALSRAELSEEQWLDLVPALSPTARQALHDRRDLPRSVGALLARLGVRGRGLPPAKAPNAPEPAVEPRTEPVAVEAPPPPAPVVVPIPRPEPSESAVAAPVMAQPVSETPPAAGMEPEIIQPADNARGEKIGAIVRRIEAYRRAKQVIEPGHADSPRLPLGEEHVIEVSGPVKACDFATDAAGRVSWCDAGVAPMLVGQRLTTDPALARLIRQHQPLRAVKLTLDGAPAIAGEWQVDAAPWFDPLGGHFLGYRGRLRRLADATKQTPAPAMPDSEADRIRQMLHELRTPINAIQVGAEIIQQQLYGATPHEYRALAAGIAGDAARMLSAFDELERLAKLSSGALDLDAGSSDLAATVRATAGQLNAHTKSRGSGFDLRLEEQQALVPLAGIEVERLVWRLLATLAGASTPGEQLKLRLRNKNGNFRLDMSLPGALARMDGDAIYKAAAGSIPQVIAAGVFGAGFALRLAKAEAKAANGELSRKGDRLRLTLPGLTGAPPVHTDGHDDSERASA